jgi:hypothetical protein
MSEPELSTQLRPSPRLRPGLAYSTAAPRRSALSPLRSRSQRRALIAHNPGVMPWAD